MINKELKFKELKKMNLEKLYELLSPEIYKINKDYVFLEIDDFELDLIIKEIILKSLDTFDNKSSYIEYFKRCFRKHMKTIIENNINNNNVFNLVDRYINYNFKETTNYKIALSSLKKISVFFDLIQYDLNFELISELINKNNIFNNLLGVVIRNKKNNILDEGVVYFLETYSMINNIPLLNFSEDLNLYEDDNYKSPEAIHLYLNEIKKYKLLTSEEEIDLGFKIISGDKDAKEKFFKSNLRLVVSLARKFLNKTSNLDILDLIQEGNLGLMRAIDGFDPKLGYRFSTYASNWILQYINRAIKDKGRNIRVPIAKYAKVSSYKFLELELENKLGRIPKISEVADIMGISFKETERLRELQYDTTSLNTVIGSESEIELIECLPSSDPLIEDIILNKEEKVLINQILLNSNLNEKEIEVIKMRFGFSGLNPMSLEAIGKKLSLTRERIRQLQNSAIFKLKKSSVIKDLAVEKGYLKNSIKEEKENILIKFQNNSSIIISNKLDDFLNKKIIRIDNIKEDTPNIVVLLYKSGLIKKEIDLFVLYYGLRLDLEDIFLIYNDKFKSFSKNRLNIINNKIECSVYFSEINNYIVNNNLILDEFEYDANSFIFCDKNIIKMFKEDKINFLSIKDGLINKIIDYECISDGQDTSLFISQLENILLKLEINELMVIYLINKNISIEKITNILKVLEKDILEILRNFYLLYKNNLVLYYNLEKSHLIKCLKQTNVL